MQLLGDAGILLRPHVAAGATKAILAALALGEQLKANTDFQTAIRAWNEDEDQYEFGKKQFQLRPKIRRPIRYSYARLATCHKNLEQTNFGSR